MSGMRIFNRLKSIFRLARRAYGPYRVQMATLGLLAFLGGIFEGIGINAVIPLLTFILNSSEQANDTISNAIRIAFNYAHIDFAPKFLLIFIVVLFLARSAALLIIAYIQVHITADYEATSRTRLLRAAVRASWPYLLKEKSGQLETILMVDVPASVSLLQKIVYSTTLVTSLVMYLVVAFNVSPLITGITLALGLLLFGLLKPLVWRARVLATKRAEGYAEISHHVTQHMAGLKTVKALSAEGPIFSAGKALFDRVKGLSLRVMLLYQFTVLSIPPLGVLYIALVFGVAFRTHFLPLAALPTILYLIYRIVTYIQQLQATLQDMNVVTPHLQRAIAYEEGARRNEEVTAGGGREFSFERELRFEHVSFSYMPGEEVLRDASFTVSKGAVVGIIGPSGSGKTTCVDLMLRLLDPTEGVLAVDGVDARAIALPSWRHAIGYVSQDFFLMRGTIRDNVRFYDESVSDGDVWRALEMANIAEYVRESPQGLDTPVGDRGVTLSAGERQRVVIARALARKPELLLLDEATSALDNESEAHLQQVIRSLKGKITIVIVAHRLSTIMDADTLVALESGRVVEIGTPQKLLKDKNSYFSKVSSILG